MSKKVLVVASSVQLAVLQQVLLSEIATGFWKNARPADHAESWQGVEIKVGTDLGASGFEMPRNYNFVNPEFFKNGYMRVSICLTSANSASLSVVVTPSTTSSLMPC